MNCAERRATLLRMALPAIVFAAGPACGLKAEQDPWPEERFSPAAALRLPLSEETNPLRLAGHLAIRGYRIFASPLLPGRCAFSPSCSAYALEAVSVRGLINGAVLGADRIMRCHGFAALGGYEYRPESGLFRDPLSANPTPLPWLARLGF